MKSIHRLSACVIAATLAIVIAPFVVANDDDELRAQQERQRQVQAETEHVVKRITTMMRVMQFYGLESPEKKIMEEMGTTLSGLSKNQMMEVIRQLELASNAKDEKDSEEAYDKAHQNHRQVVRALHEMVARFDAIKTLEQAADRLDKYAKSQLEMHLATGQSIRDLIEMSNPDLSPTVKSIIAKRTKAQGTEMKRQSDVQGDLERDIAILVRQVKELSPKLPAEQQLRIKTLETKVAEFRLYENLNLAAQKLRTLG